LKSIPISKISSDSEAFRVIAISSASQPKISAKPVRIVSDCGSRSCHIV